MLVSELNSVPADCRSIKELQDRSIVTEWKLCNFANKTYAIARIEHLSFGSSWETIQCWSHNALVDRMIQLWHVQLREAGSIEMNFDADTSLFTVTAISNTPLQGKIIASIYLSQLG